jgi:hypothetical protein
MRQESIQLTRVLQREGELSMELVFKQQSTISRYLIRIHMYIVHPYLNNANQQRDARPQRTPEMVANNTYYAEETRAPTKISVDPNGPRAPTTFSVPTSNWGEYKMVVELEINFIDPHKIVFMENPMMQTIEHQLHIMNLDQWLELQQLFLFLL